MCFMVVRLIVGVGVGVSEGHFAPIDLVLIFVLPVKTQSNASDWWRRHVCETMLVGGRW